jgi:hypothetical protein
MAKHLLLRSRLVLLKTSARCGTPIFLKANHRLESRIQEIWPSGSEGGAKPTFVPTPISAQGFNQVSTLGIDHPERRALKGRQIGRTKNATQSRILARLHCALYLMQRQEQDTNC